MGIGIAARIVLSTAAVVAFSAGCSSDDESAISARFTQQPIEWRTCPQAFGPTVQCSRIGVPLNWADPNGPMVRVGLNRLPATDPAHKIGDLVINPGGPGGAGTQFVSVESAKPGFVPAILRQRFDLIGFDPRGVGTSEPSLRCDPALANRLPSQSPRSQKEFDDMVAANRAFGATCRQLTGDLLDHADTVSVARDLEVLRQRLGGAPLNYLGLSYGTEIGAEYARLFPDKSRTLALDGALVHSQPTSTMSFYESVAVENSWNRFSAWCRVTAECALHEQNPSKVLDDLVTEAEQHPLPAPGCRSSGRCRGEVDAEDLLTNLQGRLLSSTPIPAIGDEGWLGLAAQLGQARTGDASGFASSSFTTESNHADLAVGCADFRPDFDTYAGLKAQQTLLAGIAPHTRGASQSYRYLARCQGWPALANPVRETVAEPTITPLIVNAIHDPSTSYGWAQLMATQIRGAVLLTRDGDGHTSFMSPGHTQDAIVRYLIDATAPAAGLVLPD